MNCAALIKAARARGVKVVIEQPVSSLLTSFPCMVDALEGLIQVCVWMKDFNGETAKPLKLVGAPWINRINRYAKPPVNFKPSRSLVSFSMSTAGLKRINGKRQELKDSQAYTIEFGLGVICAFLDKAFNEFEMQCNNASSGAPCAKRARVNASSGAACASAGASSRQFLFDIRDDWM